MRGRAKNTNATLLCMLYNHSKNVQPTENYYVYAYMLGILFEFPYAHNSLLFYSPLSLPFLFQPSSYFFALFSFPFLPFLACSTFYVSFLYLFLFFYLLIPLAILFVLYFSSFASFSQPSYFDDSSSLVYFPITTYFFLSQHHPFSVVHHYSNVIVQCS